MRAWPAVLGARMAFAAGARIGCIAGLLCASSAVGAAPERRPMGELVPDAVLALGKTADWVAVTPDSVWVGSSGPYAVHRIDPRTNEHTRIDLPGEPCAGLAADTEHLWVPLCGVATSLARVDLNGRRIALFDVGPAQAEGGIAAGAGSVWLAVDARGTVVRFEARTGKVRQRLHLPPGSLNPLLRQDTLWVTHASGAEITRVDARSGAVLGAVPTGPNPHFLTATGGYVWTLNQGDGSLTRIDAQTFATSTLALGTPGHGGDISSGGGMVWTTVAKTPLSGVDVGALSLRCQWIGAGGDSLGVGFGAIWLTDYNAGTVSRIPLSAALARCGAR